MLLTLGKTACLRALITSVLAVLVVGGCAIHNVKYKEFVRSKIPPAEDATSVHGTISGAKELADRAKLPHHTPRERHDLLRQASQLLRSQLGSQDYLLIGEVYGGGNARASIESLKAKFCEKAARHGGHVVLVFRAGIEERPFVYTTPGHSTTNVYGSAYGYGNYAYGSATGYTTHYPGTTYSGVLRLPTANGLVFRHVPGIEAIRQRMDDVDDEALSQIVSSLEAFTQDDSLTLDEVLNRWQSKIDEARGP